MLNLKPQWKILEPEREKIIELVQKLKIPELEARILCNRNIDTVEKAEKFLSINIIKDIGNPFEFNDMEKAVTRIKKAIAENEKIFILGDKDVDGITGIAILYKALSHLKANVSYDIHSRNEKYELSKKFIEEIKKENFKLLITVDFGISSKDALEFATSNGIDVILTDHHQPPKEIPKVFAILNPEIPSENYAFKSFSGAGVAYKLVSALFLSHHKYYLKNLTFFTISTTAELFNKKILQISALKVRNNIIIDKFNSKIKNNESLESAIKNFYNFINDSTIIGYNLDFELPILKSYIKEYCSAELNNEIVDIKKLLKQKYNFSNLKDLISILELNTNCNLEDCENKVLVLFEIFKELIYQGFKKYKKVLESFSELAALGSLADSVPMMGENRIIVKKGIEMLKNTQILGLKVLLEYLKNNSQIDFELLDSTSLSWTVIPLLNAARRVKEPYYALKLLLAENVEEAKELVEKIFEFNKERKENEDSNLEKVMEILPQKVDIENDKVFIIDVEGLKPGVTRIIGNRLKDRFFRPIIIISISEDNIGRGAIATDIEKFSYDKIYKKCGDIFIEKPGGHIFASGFSLKREFIEEFKKKVKELANEIIQPEDLIPIIYIDAELPEDYLYNIEKISNLIKLFDPFGNENNEPIFLLKNCYIKEIRQNKKGNSFFLKLLKDNNLSLNAFLWNPTDEQVELLKPENIIDIACKVRLEKWNEKKYIKLFVEDIKKAI